MCNMFNQYIRKRLKTFVVLSSLQNNVALTANYVAVTWYAANWGILGAFRRLSQSEKPLNNLFHEHPNVLMEVLFFKRPFKSYPSVGM